MPIFCLQRVNDARPDALVRAARAGDNDAWARLVARYRHDHVLLQLATIKDLDRGVTDRLLITPVTRLSLIAGRVVSNLMQAALQSLVIVVMALAIGVSFPGGPLGVSVLVLIAGLLGTAFSALSNALALVARKEQTLIAAVMFLQLPLVFLSTAYMQANLMPGWISAVADFNPVDWAITAGRQAVSAGTNWATLASYCGLLAMFAAVSLALATRALRAYQAQV